MNTFYQIWGLSNPDEVKNKIISQTKKYQSTKPKNLEEQAIKLVGNDVYEALIKGYTEKQWEEKQQICHHSLLKDCLLGLPLITTILTTNIKAFLREVIPKWLRKY